jgi:RNA polymerase sigma-70 factor (ECF subfamily)
METATTSESTKPRPLNFEDVVLPHLDAAFRLARSLTESDEDAEDIVQEAALRAFRYFRTFSGGNGRAWFLRIVRHICYDCYGHKRNRTEEAFDEDAHTASQLTPEMLLLHEDSVSLIEDAMRDLPERFRELLVLRELEGCSYRELADLLRIPIGSVMSGLSRARQAFRRALAVELHRRERPASSRPFACGPGFAVT